MEEVFSRFPHLAEQIIEKLDSKSLTYCRVVGRSWQKFIDEKDYPRTRWTQWTQIQNMVADLRKNCINDGNLSRNLSFAISADLGKVFSSEFLADVT